MHSAVWATWFGSMMYTTFFVGLTLFKNLPRQTFRDVQEQLFPVYFQLGALCVALLAVLAPLCHAVGGAQWRLLAAAAAAVGANLLYLEPHTSKIMKDRAALERMTHAVATGFYPAGKDAQLKAFAKEFGKLHGLSSLANLVALCVAVAYGWSLL